jgi:hypothetical protein
MDTLIRVVWYIVGGGILLLAIIWYVSSLVSFNSRGIVIAPFRVLGKEDKEDKLGTALSQFLQPRLTKINSDLETSQRSLMNASESGQDKARLQVWGLPSQIFVQQKVDIKTRLLEPVNIDVAVGGVQVGGFFNWLQRMLSRQRRIDFAVYYQGDSAVVAGSIESFTETAGDTLWLPLEEATDEKIVSSIAYAMLHRRLAKDPNNKLETLSATDFRTLLDTLIAVADLNHRTALLRPTEQEYEKLLSKVEALAIQAPDWYELIYLTAGIAESARDAKALDYYRQLENLAANPAAALHIDPTVRQDVQSKIHELEELAAGAVNEMEKAALRKIREDADYAVSILNPLFGMSLSAPPVSLLPKNERNSYWDLEDNKHYASPEVQHLPDVTYHEVSHLFLDRTWPESSQSTRVQVLSILESSADILASVIKQRRLRQTATQGDWVIAPGGVAWIQGGGDPATSPNRSPLRSLKEPGSAYRDEQFGSDPQLRSFDQAKGKFFDPFRLSGIPSKAFYELAIQIGTDKAIEIWLEAFRSLSTDVHQDFISLANLSSQAAAKRYGAESAEQKAVEAAWEVVRVPKREPATAQTSGGT